MDKLPVVAVVGIGSLGCYIASEIAVHDLTLDAVEQVQPQAIRTGVRCIYLHKSEKFFQQAEPQLCFQLKVCSPATELYQLQSQDLIRLQQELNRADLVFLVGALGGRNGESMVELAALCAQWQIPVVGFVVLPFQFEGTPKQQLVIREFKKMAVNVSFILKHCFSPRPLPVGRVMLQFRVITKI